jgi:P-type Ca2+ transporter type 2C
MVLPPPDEGLSSAEAAQRLHTDGPNALPTEQRRGVWHVVRETMREPMFMLLLAAGLLYLALGDLQEGLVLFAFVQMVLALTIYQEGKTERALESLRDLTSPRAQVVRDGVPVRIAGIEVVVGDLLILSEGDRVPADVLLLAGNEMQVDESLLTGEAAPVSKMPVSGQEAPEVVRPGGDNLPWVYSGTLVVQGHGTARVVATGARSEIGRIGSALSTLTAEASPLKKQTAKLIRVLMLIALGGSLSMVLVFGLMRGDWLGALLAGIALAMSLLPEEFAVVLTVLPAMGAWRLSKQNVLTRRIAAIETLGAASVLCVDKTGTLTENRMTVAQLHVDQGLAGPQTLDIDYTAPAELAEQFHALVEYSILASMAEPFDPMEKAFHRLGQHFLQGTEHLHRDWTLVQEYGLTPQLRAMSHVWRAVQGEDHVVAAKGAPEAVMDLCHLDAASQARVEQAINAMAAQGLRVLGVASARFAGDDWPEQEHDFDFEFLGLLGLVDPLRPEIPAAVAQCHAAGIRVIMITGDYPATARAIAARAGLRVDAAQEVMTGDAIAALSDTDLQERMQTVSVCARVAPEQKLRIVQALQAAGAVVAMTGDGVNDAPALKAAHVGVAMGGRGTDVAREAAALVLLDDNFASIVGAVQLGRRIFDNLRKSMSYILAVHVPIAGIAVLPVLMGWPLMLLPMHIAFLELVIDPACSMVFENEPLETDAMMRPPRDAQALLFGGMTLALALLQGLGVLLVSVSAFLWSSTWLPEGSVRAFVFVALVVGNLALIFSNRSHSVSLWTTLSVPNRMLWTVAGVTVTLLSLAVYVPWMAKLFHFEPLLWTDALLAAAMGAASVLWFEAVKFSRRKAER